MARVAYAGRDDLRILDGHDLRKAGVEGFHKTEFHNGEPVEVTNEVVAALVSDPDNFGRFVVLADEVEEEREAPKDTKDTTTKPTKSGATQSDTGNVDVK